MDALDPQRDGTKVRRFRDLYRDEFAFVWSVARRMGAVPTAVDDVVQEVFLTAYRRFDGLQFEVSARAWLYGVTRRIVQRQRRSEARHARRSRRSRRSGRPSARRRSSATTTRSNSRGCSQRSASTRVRCGR
jgi:RNA polymerase sigma factor (sigma-70 family)